MISIQILEEDDILLETDYCRPLRRCADYDPCADDWSPVNCYGGTPADHLRWSPVYNVLGPVWYGKKLKEYLGISPYHKMEFARGSIPENHIITGQWPDLRIYK